MIIRRMELQDIDEVVALEQELFTSPWSKDDFIYEIEKNAFSTILILQEDDQIAGYLGMWNLGDQSQITTLGVKKQYQGRGFAKALMNKCIEITKYLGYDNISLEVRVSNQKAIKLYQQFGFQTVAIRKDYYQDNHEDAYLMIKEMEGKECH
ncbi:ribosomal protein S18-alanine N-acetyltransferase [uncultured Thomasclavelia sp.]|uniref:ribosomal protein S18-alanine N-acetyltransferase n=1 Tax=uncultured Thomasclavelia sp. TaxID=3025759 RepID=UPI0025CBB661|nr:ribosomal protein S18-alanine N-acetyltransferase [uncultured Thomasclavelia sp.]